jgi:hypothetical protein
MQCLNIVKHTAEVGSVRQGDPIAYVVSVFYNVKNSRAVYCPVAHGSPSVTKNKHGDMPKGEMPT